MEYPDELRYHGAADEVAKALMLSRQTIYKWRSTNEVPPRYQEKLRKMARRKAAALRSVPAPPKVPEAMAQDVTPVGEVTLADIAEMMAIYFRQKGM